MGNNRRENFKPEVTKMSTPITVDAVLAKYIETRDIIEAKTKAFKAEVAELKELQQRREQWFATQMNTIKATSIKSAGVGIAFFKKHSSATMADRQTFLAWVREDWAAREAFLDARVSKTQVDNSIEEGNTPPPGTNYTTVQVVQVNRA